MISVLEGGGGDGGGQGEGGTRVPLLYNNNNSHQAWQKKDTAGAISKRRVMTRPRTMMTTIKKDEGHSNWREVGLVEFCSYLVYSFLVFV